MPGAAGVVDAEAAAEGVEGVRRAGEAAAGELEGVDRPRPGDAAVAGPGELGVQELHVEGGIVDDEAGVAEEGDELRGHRAEGRLVGEEGGGEAVDLHGLGRHLALGVDVAVEDPAGGHVVEELHRPELDDAVAAVRVEAGGLGVEHDLTHAACPALILASSASTSARAASTPRSVTMTKSARARFSASGICRARMRSSASGVMPGRASTRARCTASGAVTTRTPSRPRSPPVSKRSGMSKTTTSAPACAAAKASRSAATSGWTRASICARSPGSAMIASRRRSRSTAPAGDRLRREVGDGGGAGAAGGVEPVHRRVGVPDRDAGLGEEPGGGGLAHADGAGQAEAVGPAHGASTAARSASSTSGRTPNQRSKPGAPWWSSIPSPSTATRPSRRASATKGVGSPP